MDTPFCLSAFSTFDMFIETLRIVAHAPMLATMFIGLLIFLLGMYVAGNINRREKQKALVALDIQHRVGRLEKHTLPMVEHTADEDSWGLR